MYKLYPIISFRYVWERKKQIKQVKFNSRMSFEKLTNWRHLYFNCSSYVTEFMSRLVPAGVGQYLIRLISKIFSFTNAYPCTAYHNIFQIHTSNEFESSWLLMYFRVVSTLIHCYFSVHFVTHTLLPASVGSLRRHSTTSTERNFSFWSYCYIKTELKWKQKF